MIDHDNLEEFRDPQTYDLEDEGYYDDWQLAARTSDCNFSLHDLCLSETGLACLLVFLFSCYYE